MLKKLKGSRFTMFFGPALCHVFDKNDDPKTKSRDGTPLNSITSLYKYTGSLDFYLIGG